MTLPSTPFNEFDGAKRARMNLAHVAVGKNIRDVAGNKALLKSVVIWRKQFV